MTKATSRSRPNHSTRRRKRLHQSSQASRAGWAGCLHWECSASSPRASPFGGWGSYHRNTYASGDCRSSIAISCPTFAWRRSRERHDHSRCLPATTHAFTTANIFARASGYIDKRPADIGDRVKAGQLLAEIVAANSTIKSSRPRPPWAKQGDGSADASQYGSCAQSHGHATSRSWKKAGRHLNRAPSTCRT